MQYQLKIWNGSELAESRIYVNGGALDASDKLFIKSGKNLLGLDSWDASLKGDFSSWSMKVHGRGSNQYDIGLHIAEEALAERGWQKLSFLEILAKLRNGEEPKEPVNVAAIVKPVVAWAARAEAFEPFRAEIAARHKGLSGNAAMAALQPLIDRAAAELGETPDAIWALYYKYDPDEGAED